MCLLVAFAHIPTLLKYQTFPSAIAHMLQLVEFSLQNDKESDLGRTAPASIE